MPADLNMKILVVDDMSTMRRIVKNILKQLGFANMEEAENGQEALQKLRADTFGFVVSDWNMPNMTGLDLLKQVRTVDNDVRFVMMTGRSDLDSVKVARDHGIDSYLRKPFSPEQLQKKLQTSCRGLPTTHQQTARLVG